jgi:putative toxin-antitoxin system antitoxin component (TIGR02293 family)|tara:strand:- start:8047 stop:8634 length:588 start_codon:yes stop_codon:yes gene_type:complete
MAIKKRADSPLQRKMVDEFKETYGFTGFGSVIHVPKEVTSLNAKGQVVVTPKLSEIVVSHLKSVSFDWNDDKRGFGLVSMIRNGIDYKTFQTVAKTTSFNDADWANILGTTTRTLERYKKDNKTFAPTQTEKIIEIQQLMQYGREVFEDTSNFEAWLTRENVALGGVVPKILLDTSVGLGMVKDALGRIEHGIFA